MQSHCVLRYLGDGTDTWPRTRALSTRQHRMSHCVLRYLGDGTDSLNSRTLSTGQHRISLAVPHCALMYLGDGTDTLDKNFIYTGQHRMSHAVSLCTIIRYVMEWTRWTRTLSSGQHRMSHCTLRYTYIGDGMESSVGLEHRICPMKFYCTLKYLLGDGMDSLDENLIYWTAQDIPCSSTVCTPTKLE